MKRLEKKFSKSLVFICINYFYSVLDHTEQECEWMPHENRVLFLFGVFFLQAHSFHQCFVILERDSLIQTKVSDALN